MIDLIKKSLLAGVGAAVFTKEKVEEVLADYVREGKVTSADARVMAEKIAEQGRREFEELSTRLGGKLKDLVASADATTQARIASLESRVRVLEEKLTPPPTRAGEP